MKAYNGYTPRDIDELIEESGDCIYEFEEGSLLDNILFYSTRYSAYVAAIEEYRNSWTSAYKVYIGTMEQVYSVWDKYITPAA